jgi:hypothetical protein
LAMIELNMSSEKHSSFFKKVNVSLDKFFKTVFSISEIGMLQYGLFMEYDSHFDSTKGDEYFASLRIKLEAIFPFADFSLGKYDKADAFFIFKERIMSQFGIWEVESEDFDKSYLSEIELQEYAKISYIHANDAYDLLEKYIGKPESSESLISDSDKCHLSRWLAEGLG